MSYVESAAKGDRPPRHRNVHGGRPSASPSMGVAYRHRRRHELGRDRGLRALSNERGKARYRGYRIEGWKSGGRGYRMQHTAYSTQHTVHSTQHTAYSMQDTAYSIQHTGHSIQHTAYSIQHTAHTAQSRSSPLYVRSRECIDMCVDMPVVDVSVDMCIHAQAHRTSVEGEPWYERS